MNSIKTKEALFTNIPPLTFFLLFFCKFFLKGTLTSFFFLPEKKT